MSMSARGRGAYFKAKYGGGGSERGGRGMSGDSLPNLSPAAQNRPDMRFGNLRTRAELTNTLHRINRKPYGAYKDLLGKYVFPHGNEHPEFILSVEHVQSDAYAPPSRIRAIMPLSRTEFPPEAYSTRTRKIALCDYLTRHAHALIKKGGWDNATGGKGWAGDKGGDFSINPPSQQVLERNSCLISQREGEERMIEMRFSVGLPAAGRSILGDKAIEILNVKLPRLVQASMLWRSLDQAKLENHIKSVEDQHFMRESLDKMGLVAFIGNNSILPRESGVSQLPMTGPETISFKSPPSLEVTIITPNRGPVTGMGIPKGITVLSGGGFHGKSTLLEAIELGIYNHVPGDGRELVVTNEAVKIRAEDGRSVVSTDITPFIGVLPGGKTTEMFTSEDASGSTSMAANIQEALELGAKTLLLDEDSCATNLLIRDQRMQALIQAEPITPLVAKVQSLFKEHGVSTILVIGGCGDYLSVANLVIAMENYLPHDLTTKALQIITAYPINLSSTPKYGPIPNRIPSLPPFHTAHKGPIARSTTTIVTNMTPDIDISELGQLVETGQVRTCAEALRIISKFGERKLSMGEWVRELEGMVEREGLDGLHVDGWKVGDMVAVRGVDVLRVVNRVRGLKARNRF
ncbi:hypothetical protein BDZ91DRAFT_712784 [Kalaharituber pfeilii]|nr:hypothetical protein BDZ91DRAFT_712784 [Kalaharituber pfeilii]